MGINQGPISLDQKYTQETGHVFTTGIQALVRLPMAQIRRDGGISSFRHSGGMVTQIENGTRVSGHEVAIFTRRPLWSRFVMRIAKYPT